MMHYCSKKKKVCAKDYIVLPGIFYPFASIHTRIVSVHVGLSILLCEGGSCTEEKRDAMSF